MSIITNNPDATISRIIRTTEPHGTALHDSLAEYRSLNGGQFQNLTFAFEVGCLMADAYHVVTGAIFLASDDGAKDHFAPLERMSFMHEDGSALKPLSTIGVFDQRNQRMAYVVVISLGYNMVYFTRTQLDAKCAEIDLIATDTTRASSRIYNYWRDGSSLAKVMIASLFGFEFDDKDDEIFVPSTATENVFEQSKKIAAEVREAIEA